MNNFSKNINNNISLTYDESILWRELTLNTRKYHQYCMSISNNEYFCHRILQEKKKEYSLDAQIFICKPDYVEKMIINKALFKLFFKFSFFACIACMIQILYGIITSPSFDSILFVLPYLNFISEQPNLVIYPLKVDAYLYVSLFIPTMIILAVSLKLLGKAKSVISNKSFHKKAFSIYKWNNNQFIQNFKNYTWEDESDGNTKSKHIYKNLLDFIHLCLMNPKERYGLKSDYIDNMWHEIISDTLNYQLLCISLNKDKNTAILHHIPGTPDSENIDEENYIKFLKDYCKTYQILPDREIWPYSDEVATILADEAISSNKQIKSSDSENDLIYAYIPMTAFMGEYAIANNLNRTSIHSSGTNCSGVVTVNGFSGSGCSGGSGCGSSCGGGCGGGCGSSC